MQKIALLLLASWLVTGFAQAQSRRNDTPAPHRIAGQMLQTALDSLHNNIGLWNDFFNGRDTALYYTLADSVIAISTANGTQTSLSQFSAVTRRLLAKRPDIVMYLNASAAEINNAWHLAYDSGEWAETWTEPDGAGKSEIRGKYWRMWKQSGGNWKAISLVLTPLSCTGSYCNP